MAANTIDAKLLAKMFLAGAKNLESKKDYINELNVFPVPDGDTGTNMTLTIMSAAKDIYELQNSGADFDMKSLCKSMSSGSLRGARGNSGVILSQLLRGFTKVVRDFEELDIATISAGSDKAVETAYKAVMKPKEGTILTVAKGMAVKANELFESGCDDPETFFKEILAYGFQVLEQTPEMLPVLKEAGVVDSGGQGLMEFLQGAFDCYAGKEIEFSMDDKTTEAAGEVRMLSSESGNSSGVKYGYKLSYVLHYSQAANKNFNVKHEEEFRNYLEGISKDAVLEAGDLKANISLTTNDPGLAIQKGIKYGELTDISIENIRYVPSREEISSPKSTEPQKRFGFISVAVGNGIAEIFRTLGVDQIIEGGQTMNPSTEDLLNAIEVTNAEYVFVLPNNKNIIMAANQARDLTEDKKVIVIPTKTIPQGISALISFVPDATPEENEKIMLDIIGNVKTGQVTYAVRDTAIEGVTIHEGDYMGIGDAGILSNGNDLESVVLEMTDRMVDDSSELISIYYGADVTEADAVAIHEKLSAKYTDCDIEFQSGGQPIYYYIISVE
ncbi:MAG: DAK2 domain-containing protein [Lachnospiraceae bacterium]